MEDVYVVVKVKVNVEGSKTFKCGCSVHVDGDEDLIVDVGLEVKAEI